MRIALTTDDTPERERFAIWRESVFRSFAPLTVERSPDQEFASAIDARLFDGLSTIDITGSGYSMRRTVSDIAAASAEFYLAFQVMEGPIEVETAQGSQTFRPGDIGIGAPDTAWGMAPHRTRYRTRNVVIPRALVDPWLMPGASIAAVHLPASRGFNALLGDFMSSLTTHAEGLSPVEIAAASQTLGRLMAVAGGFDPEQAEAGASAVGAARLDQARGLIEQRFAEPDLNPARVAKALGISLRQLHLLFEPTGRSFSERLMLRRLQECHARLSDPTALTRSITEIAFDSGFENLQTFYRAFRRTFGMTPGDVRAQVLARR
jgi:AraC-like DNA-binding protein